MTPKLIVEQKLTAFVNQYRVYDVGPDGSKGDLVAFAQQKRVTLREKIIFYADEQKTREVFSLRAEKALDVHGKYFVEDPAGNTIGAFRKSFKKSLLNSTWHIIEGEQPIITVSEHNKVLAFVRRAVAFIPFVDDIAGVILAFTKYHFVVTDEASGEVLGMHRKTKRFHDHYELSLHDKAYKRVDWRTWAAMAVALDALQDR